MGPIWGRQDPGGPHVGPMNFAIWVSFYCHIVCSVLLLHWGLIKIVDSLQPFQNAFSWEKTFVYLFRFHLHLFLRVQLTMGHHWFTQWLGTEQTTSHYLDPWQRLVMHIYITGRSSDVIMSAMASQITSLTIVCLLNRLFRRKSKKTCNDM